jgi:hypothetical protein
MNIQEIAAFAVVLAAVAYLAVRTWNSLHRKDCSKGCGCAGEAGVKTKS